MKNRGIIIAGLGVAVLSALSWQLKRSDWLSQRLRDPIRQGLAKASGRSVQVGGVGASLSGWIWLHDVSLGPDPQPRALDVSLTAKAVGLRLDRWDLLRGKIDIASLKELQVESPQIYVLHRDLDEPAVAAPEPSEHWRRSLQGLPLPPVRFSVADGRAWDQDLPGSPRLAAEDLVLQVEPRPEGGLRLNGRAQLPGSGRVEVFGRTGEAWAGLQMDLRARDVELARLKLFPEALTVTAGRFSGDLNAQLKEGAWPDGFALRGQGRLDGVAISRAGKVGLEALRAQWRLQDGRVDLDSLAASAWGGTVRGHAWVDLRAESLSGTVKAEQADLAGLALLAGAPPDLGLSGPSTVELSAFGSLTGPAVEASLSATGAQWQGHPLRQVDLALHMRPGSALAEGTLAWDGGRGDLALRLAEGSLRSVHFKMVALPADWLQAWSTGPLDGRLDGEADYDSSGVDGAGNWSVDLRAPRVHLRGRELLRANLRGSGDAHAARFRLDTDLPQWPQLSARAEGLRQKDGSWILRNAFLLQQGKTLASAHGTWRAGNSVTAQTLALVLKSSQLTIASLPGPAWLAQVSGTVQGDGELFLGPTGWRGSLQAQAPGLSVQGWGLPATMALRFGPEGVSLSSLVLRRGELRASAWAPQVNGPWAGEVHLQRASLAPAAAFLPAFLSGLSGTATGSLRLDEATRRWGAQLQLVDPLPRALSRSALGLDLAVEGPHWDLKGLTLDQDGSRVLTGTAAWDTDGRRPWTGDARWQQLRAAGGSASGRLVLSGGGGSDGQVVIDPWDLGGQALPGLQAVFHFDHGFQAAQAQWGPGTRLQLRPDGQGWSLRADLEGMDPGPLAGLWSGTVHATALRLTGWMDAAPLGGDGPLQLRVHVQDQGAPGSRVDGEAELGKEGLSSHGSFQGLDLARLGLALQDLGKSPPALKGHSHGDWEGRAGSLTINASATGLSVVGLDLGPATLHGGWDHGRAWVGDLQAGGEGPRVHLAGVEWRSLPDGWAASGTVDLRSLPLAIFDVGAQGKLEAASHAGQHSAKMHWDQLQVGVRRWKSLELEGKVGQGRWSFQESGRKPALVASGSYGGGVFKMDDIKARSGQGQGWLKGSVGPQGRLDLQGEAQGMDAADLAGIMGWDQDWHGSAYGTLSVGGDVDHAKTLVNAKVEDGSVCGLPFDLANGLVKQDGDWVDLSPVDPIRLTRRNGVALEVRGRIPLDPPDSQAMVVTAELKQGGLGLFAGLPGIADASGPLELKLRFHGLRKDPLVDGMLKVTDGIIRPSWMLPDLEKVDLLAQMEDGRVDLQQARGQVAGGGPLVRLETVDPRRPAWVFDHWEPASFNLRLRSSASGLPVRSTRWLRFVEGTVLPDLQLTGSWEDPVLSGTVELVKGSLDKAVVNWPAVFDPPMPEDSNGFLDRLTYDLKLQARRDVLVRTGAAQAFVDTGEDGLRIGGGPGGRTLQGRLRLVQGSVDYLLASFKLATDHDSSIEMRGSDAPGLDLWGVKSVRGAYLNGDPTPRDVDVRLHAFGPLGQVQMRLESDTNDLSQAQLASIAGLGMDASDPRNQGGFARLLGKVPASLLTRWARRTGVLDEVGVRLPMVEDAIGGPQPSPGVVENFSSLGAQPTPVSASAQSLVEVNAGKYVGENLYLGVSGRLDRRQEEDPSVALGGKVEYRLKDNTRVSVEDSHDITGKEDNRVMLERSSRFENYNPARRRWDRMAPTPSPLPSPSPAPGPSPTPGVGPSP